jgi:hypothetical protein
LLLFGLGLSRCHRGADRDEQGGERKAHVRSSGGVSVQPSATALVPQPPVIRARKGEGDASRRRVFFLALLYRPIRPVGQG